MSTSVERAWGSGEFVEIMTTDPLTLSSEKGSFPKEKKSPFLREKAKETDVWNTGNTRCLLNSLQDISVWITLCILNFE